MRINVNLYDLRRYFVWAFLALAVCIVVYFLYYSSTLIDGVADQERARMQVWANATRELASLDINDEQYNGIDFLLSVIEENRTIPVLLTDDNGNILMQRNFALPERPDSLDPMAISGTNEEFLQKRLRHLKGTTNVIHIHIAPGVTQHLYYEDSSQLKNLNRYPYIMVLVLGVFFGILYYALLASKRAEQNKVWVGLSKETAHQLGTPISSLMAWMQLLEAQGVDKDTVDEMNKDVNRLSVIASRFGKVGSAPQMEHECLNTVVTAAADYMRSRISSRITLQVIDEAPDLYLSMSEPLLEWVMENLIKNAVDAMDGRGYITVVIKAEGSNAVIEVTDTGKGMTRKQKSAIFNPGYTTKKRGWGLGLTLARRIIEQYHRGHIYVARTEPGVGTTFRIELPKVATDERKATADE